MLKINRILLLAAALLLLLSAWSYRDSVTRAERFERGQKFLSNLNPDEIAEILITAEGETTHLRRGKERFSVVTAGGYRARNEAVNRFIRDVLDLGLEKKIGSGDSLAEELKVQEAGADTRQVVLKNAAGNDMVSFLIGAEQEGGDGNYVRRIDGDDTEIYLTSTRVSFSSGADDFLDQEILDVQASQVVAIRGVDFSFETIDGSLQLADLPAGKKENVSKASQAKGALSYLRFDHHFLADDAEVQGLYFRDSLSIELDDKTGYDLAVASRDGKHYLRIQGFSTITSIEIDPNDDEETVKEKSEILARADEIREFNNYHGSWIYQVSEATADKARLKKSDLIENA